MPRTLPKPMAETDVTNFFKVIDSLRDRLIFLLMLRCGLRVSETCTLTWEQIDVDAGTIRINNGKGQIDRVVYLAPDVEKALKPWRVCQSTSVYLFASQIKKGAPLTPRTVQRLMARYLEQASIIRSYTPHCLRHTFATQLLNAGMPLEVLKELMGHQSIQMTLRYAQLYESTKRQQYNQAMERIEQRPVNVAR
jgi:site-specific recombinase XerD